MEDTKKTEKKIDSEEQEFGKTEALNVIKQVCSNYKGNLSEHNLIQQSIKILEQ